MEKEVIFKKLKFGNSGLNLIVNAPAEYLSILEGAIFDTTPNISSMEKCDIKRDTVWAALALAGLRPVSQIAINEVWSALRGRDPELVGK
ncbi:MAG: hypothetical protein Q8S54_03125 [Bacteroidota bacterium]|nr:hypothetical protein [Odoribacter sp.]MDP3642165.1 hypothetical protein [Bacteroidota bacterium]